MKGASFFPTRGCVYAIPADDGTSKGGLYRLDGITDQKSSDSAVLVTGLDMVDSDVVAPVITTEDLKVLYVFGKSFGRVSVQGNILLGQASNPPTKLTAVQTWFQNNRVSASKKPVDLSIAKQAYSVFITGMTLGGSDPEFNNQTFALEGVIAN